MPGGNSSTGGATAGVDEIAVGVAFDAVFGVSGNRCASFFGASLEHAAKAIDAAAVKATTLPDAPPTFRAQNGHDDSDA